MTERRVTPKVPFKEWPEEERRAYLSNPEGFIAAHPDRFKEETRLIPNRSGKKAKPQLITARKEHLCNADCSLGPIEVGQRAIKHSFVYSGRWNTRYYHLPCWGKTKIAANDPIETALPGSYGSKQ